MPPRKKSDIFTPTKHLDCNQLWRIQSPTALRKEFRKHFKSSPRRLPHNAASLNKEQIITDVNDILPRAQAFIESVGGAFDYKLKSFKNRLSRSFFYCGYFFLKCPTLGNTNNIIIII